ncbi:EamA family transporter [Clostridium tetani]|nr:EamA family transporter [Clostridium tetani]RXI44433.1 EamA family transporter [Clostridium tetani]RXI53199.1 EamA family transporter [Clostridium tetani]RXI78032.1 EamA family transporter [Clostridium tetani]RXM59930.1 EamA family transporter [Clostridium tetani]
MYYFFNFIYKGAKILKKQNLWADISLLIVAIIWGSGFVATKNALDSISPFFITTLRFSISTLAIGIIFFKRIKNIDISHLKAGFIIGFFLFSAFSTQTIGLLYTTASKQAFLTGTNVVMVPFFYWFISKEKPNLYNITATFLCLIGISLLTLDGSMHINKGDLLTLICAIFFACHVVATGYFTKKYDPIILTFTQFFVTTILSFLSMIILEGVPSAIPKEGIFPVFYLGIFSTFIAFLIQTIAQRYTSPSHTAIVLCLESVFGTILSCILLGDKFTYKIFIGCVLIFLAIITAETKWEFLRDINKNVQTQEE